MQELALKSGNAVATGNIFLSLAGQKQPQSEGQENGNGLLSVADKFTRLIQMFAGAKPALPINDSLVGDEKNNWLQPSLEADVASINGEPQIDIKNLLLMAGAEGGAEDKISPEILAQLAALIQHIPQLQVMLNSKADLQVVAEAIDYLQMTKTPDLAQFDLPTDVKDLLMKLSQDKVALADLGGAIQKLQANPELVKAIDFAADGNVVVKPVVEEVAALPAEKAEMPADKNVIKAVQEDIAVKVKQPLNAVDQGQNLKSGNILAEERMVVDLPGKPNRTDILKFMSDVKINAADGTHMPDPVNAQAESAASANFDQALTQALHASDALQSGKHNIMSAAALDAYGMRTATGGIPAHIASMQVAVQMQKNLQQRTNNFFIQLQPEELGRIEVTLKFEGNRVRALISAEKEETLQLLKQDAKALDRALQGSGVETDAGSLEFSLGQNFQNFDEARKNHRHDHSFGTMIANEVTDTDIKQDLNAAMIMMMAEGRVDVKL